METLIAISLLFHLFYFKRFTKPISLLQQAIHVIEQNDHMINFSETGFKDLDQLIKIFNSMISQLRTEKTKLKEQHYFFQSLIQSVPSGVIILDYDNRIVKMNSAGERLLGVSERKLLNLKVEEHFHPLCNELSSMEDGVSKLVTISGLEKYKCYRDHFIDQGFKRSFFVFYELSEDIFNQEKIAYERIIRLMSHEINNSIGAVNSILETSLYYKQQLCESDREDFSNAINISIDRNRNLNNFMRKLADVIRIPDPFFKIIDLHEILGNVHTLYSRKKETENITWKMNFLKGNFILKCDQTQIEQVLINIIKNSVESIENSGFIEIETISYPEKVLIIRDNGCGINESLKQNIFTPFFSTKKDGYGLGLTFVREVLTNHKMKFSLASNAGITEFKIFFNDHLIINID
jgi:nitrogen fixation/metabolism regulation signal transduction histidine kinase